MNNPYENNDVKQFNFKLGALGEQIVRDEINRFDGYRTVKSEFKCPDYKIFINNELAGYAEVKVQKARNLINGSFLGFSFNATTINSYRMFNTPKTPLEFYVVDPEVKRVFWDYFSELEHERRIDGAVFPFDKYAPLFDGDAHHWSIQQFRYSFSIDEDIADEMQQIIKERDELVGTIQHGQVNVLRAARMNSYAKNATAAELATPYNRCFYEPEEVF